MVCQKKITLFEVNFLEVYGFLIKNQSFFALERGLTFLSTFKHKFWSDWPNLINDLSNLKFIFPLPNKTRIDSLIRNHLMVQIRYKTQTVLGPISPYSTLWSIYLTGCLCTLHYILWILWLNSIQNQNLMKGNFFCLKVHFIFLCSSKGMNLRNSLWYLEDTKIF